MSGAAEFSLSDALSAVTPKRWTSIGKELKNLALLPATSSLDAWNSDRHEAFLDVFASCKAAATQGKLIDLLSNTLGKNHKLTLKTEEMLLDGYVNSEMPLHGLTNDSLESSNLLMAPGKIKNSKTKRMCCCLVVLSISVIFFVVLLISTVVGLLLASRVRMSIARIAGGDTVVIDAQHSFFFGEFHVTQCEKLGDYSHISDLAIVKTSQLIHRKWSQTITRRMEEFAGSRNVGVLGNITYLLPGAELHYEICLESDTATENTATIYVFDDTDQYILYLTGESNKIRSVASFEISIGINNSSVCTEITFTTDHPGYYYVSGETPVALTYLMKSTLQSGYYNQSDYSPDCSVSDFSDCDVHIPGGFFSNEEYTLLASARPSAVSDPPFTHLCAEAKKSKGVVAVAGATGSVSLLVVIILSILLVVQGFRWFCRNIRRIGYDKLL